MFQDLLIRLITAGISFLPTEEGSGMASWYENPLGKNTAVYLFNLEEGVQVSFYATADSPDKSYEVQKLYVPTPEIRTPIVPIIQEQQSESDTEQTTDISVTTEMEKQKINLFLQVHHLQS